MKTKVNMQGFESEALHLGIYKIKPGCTDWK